MRHLKSRRRRSRTGQRALLNAEEILALHADVMGITEDSARDRVRDWNLLESALARPRHAAQYEGADLVRQSATLLWGLVNNHPFHDGNKRTAYVVTATFLRMNGCTIVATEDEKFELMLGASQRLSTDDVEQWLRAHVVLRR